MARAKQRLTGRPDAEAHRLADRIFRAIAAHHGFEPGGDAVAVNIGTSLDALLYVAALMIEATPQLSSSPRAVRDITDDMNVTLKDLMKEMRLVTERTGKHPLENFGGGEVFEQAMAPS